MAPSTSRAPSSSGGAQTVQIHNPPPTTTQAISGPVLHLRGATREQEVEVQSLGTGRRIQWAEGVVDNEGLGRKQSKVCCIYHAPKGIDESSDESSSDSSDGDSGDDGAARPNRKEGRGHSHGKGKGKGKGAKKAKARDTSPNAYEKMPRRRDGDGEKPKG